jgi:hypothetical protein
MVTDDQQWASLGVMAVIVMPQPRVYRHRPVLVVADLADLHGPTAGAVQLPIWLFWSGASAADRVFSLDGLVERAELYRIVLREARQPTDLTGLLDRDILLTLWPDLSWRLPAQVRAAWEDQHPALRATGRSRAEALRLAS